MATRDLKFAALTDVGRQRDHNEDNFLIDKKLGLFVVCDGMGGHAAGEVASALAVHVVHEEVKRGFDLIEDYAAGQRGASRVTTRDVSNMLEFTVNRASRRIYEEAHRDGRCLGMGTTLVALLVVRMQAFIVHVGDSRIYLLREGVLRQLTSDHTAYNEILKRKTMPREQVERLVPKNAITRAVGVYEHVESDSQVLDLKPGDRFLLCTDGLSNYFEAELAQGGSLLANGNEEEAVHKLIAFANERGGTDNITSVVVTIGEPHPEDGLRARELQLRYDVLSKSQLFRSLNQGEILRVLELCEVLGFPAGEAITRRGDEAEHLCVLFRGAVRLLYANGKTAVLNPGDFFGELALLRNQPREVGALAVEDSELFFLRRSDFVAILRREPALATKLLWQLAAVLADQLLETQSELDAARKQRNGEEPGPALSQAFPEEDDLEDRQTLILPPEPRAPQQRIEES